MMNFFYESFPETILVNGTRYRVVSDFREWIKWLDMIDDDEVTLNEKILFTHDMFYDRVEEPVEGILKSMIDFLSLSAADEPETQTSSRGAKKKLLSYRHDWKYIIPDFLSTYGIDLLTVDYLHWFKFRMLLDGLPEETMTKQVIYYRSIDLNKVKDKKERARLRKVQDSVKLQDKGVLNDEEIANAFM